MQPEQDLQKPNAAPVGLAEQSSECPVGADISDVAQRVAGETISGHSPPLYEFATGAKEVLLPLAGVVPRPGVWVAGGTGVVLAWIFPSLEPETCSSSHSDCCDA